MSTDTNQSGYSVEEMNLVEAVLFSSPRPMPVIELKKLLPSRHKGGIKSIIDLLNQKYAESNMSFRIREIGGGLQFYLLSDFAMQVEKYFSVQRNRKLTPAGLETLAIIAYKQPVTKHEVEQIRGVASDGVVQTLLDRKLIKPSGRAERIGKPLLYSTTGNFLEYFGINSLAELPRLVEIAPRTMNNTSQDSLKFEFSEPTESAPPLESPDQELL